MAKGKLRGDVQWILPGKKKPYMYSTMATSDYVDILATKRTTTQEVYDAIVFDEKAKEALQKFIDAGYGNKWFRRYLLDKYEMFQPIYPKWRKLKMKEKVENLSDIKNNILCQLELLAKDLKEDKELTPSERATIVIALVEAYKVL